MQNSINHEPCFMTEREGGRKGVEENMQKFKLKKE